MTIEIKNAGPGVAAVLMGDPKDPSDVKVLQSGDTIHMGTFPMTIVDDSYGGLKNRRVGDQAFSGRRKADPTTDQRSIKKAKAAAAATLNPPFGAPGHVLQPGELGYVPPPAP